MSLGLVRNRSCWFGARGVTPDPTDAGAGAAGSAASESPSDTIIINISVHNGKSQSSPVCQ